MLTIAFLIAVTLAAVGTLYLEVKRYRDTMADLGDQAWHAYYHERIWNPKDEHRD